MRTTYPSGSRLSTTFGGVGGSGSFSAEGGEGYAIRVLGITGDTAVLDITRQ